VTVTVTAAPVGPPASSRWRARGALAGVVVVLGLIGLIVVIAVRSPVERAALDPDGPTPQGSRALAVLLGRHGHPVAKVPTTDAAIDRASAGDVTVLVPFPYNLSSASMRKLAALPSSDRVVLVEPDTASLDALKVGVRISGADLPDRKDPGCALPEAVSAGDADLGGYTFASSGPGFTTCYQDSLGVLDRGDGAEIVLIGSHDLLTNDRLAKRGNAALALGLLGAHRDVVWLQRLTPEPAAAGEPGKSLTDLLPGWVPVALWMLVAAAVLAALWQGRRLGGPVSEPLPVVVRSTETVEGRARLYQRAKARPEAAAALRSAALGRLAPMLGLGSRPEPAEVCQTAAERSGWPADAVAARLYGPPPADDYALVELADGLDALVAAVTANGKQTVPTDQGHPS
jgi:hypothetical protein